MLIFRLCFCIWFYLSCWKLSIICSSAIKFCIFANPCSTLIFWYTSIIVWFLKIWGIVIASHLCLKVISHASQIKVSVPQLFHSGLWKLIFSKGFLSIVELIHCLHTLMLVSKNKWTALLEWILELILR